MFIVGIPKVIHGTVVEGLSNEVIPRSFYLKRNVAYYVQRMADLYGMGIYFLP